MTNLLFVIAAGLSVGPLVLAAFPWSLEADFDLSAAEWAKEVQRFSVDWRQMRPNV